MPCFYCGIRLRKSGLAMRTRDHIVPKSQGGTKTVEACLRCNGLKAALSLEEFRVLCGGIEFWAERTARIERDKTTWIYEFDSKQNTMTPVAYEKIIYPLQIAIPRGKRIPVQSKEKKPQGGTANHTAANMPPDLAGVKFGRFTVLRRLTGKWEVLCECGAIDHRSSKAVTNPANGWDACDDCRQPIGRLRSDIYKATGVEFSWEECFTKIYGKKEDFGATMHVSSIELDMKHRRPKNKNSDQKILHVEEEILHVEQEILRETRETHREVEEIEHLLRPHRLTKSVVNVFSGDIPMPNNVLVFNVGQTSIDTITPFLADGVTPSGGVVSGVSVTFSDPSASFVINPDNTVTFTGVADSAGVAVSGTTSCSVQDTDSVVSTWTTAFTIQTIGVTPPPPTQLTQVVSNVFSTPTP